ncbi:MAG: hypothetical protein U0807_00580 [Candidatus Binatia bacterium]
MRRALFVFALSDPALLPLLKALVAAGDFDLVLIPSGLVERARDAGLPASDGFALLDTAAAARIEEEGRRVIARLETREADLARHFGGPDHPLWRRLRGPFLRKLLNVAVTAEAARLILEALAARHRLAAALLGFDTVPVARATVATARRLGVPTIHLPHGVLGRPRVQMPWQGARVYADVVCAPGPFSQEGYLAAGADPTAVALTGCPRWDSYAGITDATRARLRATIAPALRLDPARPIVVFGPSWVERQTANSCGYQGLELAVYERVLAGVRAHQQRGVQLVVKLHPGEVTRHGVDPQRLVDGYVGVARRAGLQQVTVTSDWKAELLACADAVVVVNSNLGIEALLCERPVVNVPLLADEHDALFTPGEGVLALERPEDTTAAVDRLLGDVGFRARLAAGALDAARRFVHRPDGRASERVAAVVAAQAERARAGVAA